MGKHDTRPPLGINSMTHSGQQGSHIFVKNVIMHSCDMNPAPCTLHPARCGNFCCLRLSFLCVSSLPSLSCPCHVPHLGQEKSLNLLVYFFVSTQGHTHTHGHGHGHGHSCLHAFGAPLSLSVRSLLSLLFSVTFSLILFPLVPMQFDYVQGWGVFR